MAAPNLELLDLWDQPVEAPRPRFHGATFDRELDGPRLERQLDRVREYLRDGQWRTLAEIRAAAGGSEASVSARLRDLRKPAFGGHTVERQRVPGQETSGLWRYRLLLRP